MVLFLVITSGYLLRVCIAFCIASVAAMLQRAMLAIRSAPRHYMPTRGAASLPTSMRAVQVAQRVDGKRPRPEDMYLADVPLPTADCRLGPNDLLVKVAAAGVNRPDVLQRMGAYPAPKGNKILRETCDFKLVILLQIL